MQVLPVKSGNPPPPRSPEPKGRSTRGSAFRPARHLDSWHHPEQFRILADGKGALPQIALAGRSNAGKSSLVNRLLGEAMAKVSKTPGKTRALEVFHSALPCIFVDLPGYGFASRSQEERAKWGALIQRYLEHMPSLRGIVIIVDGRHAPFESDLQMVEWVRARGLKGLILLNKWDATTQAERGAVLRAWEDLMGGSEWSIIPASCKSGLGIDAVEGILKSWGRHGSH